MSDAAAHATRVSREKDIARMRGCALYAGKALGAVLTVSQRQLHRGWSACPQELLLCDIVINSCSSSFFGPITGPRGYSDIIASRQHQQVT